MTHEATRTSERPKNLEELLSDLGRAKLIQKRSVGSHREPPEAPKNSSQKQQAQQLPYFTPSPKGWFLVKTHNDRVTNLSGVGWIFSREYEIFSFDPNTSKPRATMNIGACTLVIDAPDRGIWLAGVGALAFCLVALSFAATLLFMVPSDKRLIPGFLVGTTLAVFPFSSIFQDYLAHTLEGSERLIVLFIFSGGFGVAGFFKSIAVATGTNPFGSERNLSTFLLWFTSTPEPRFGRDGRTIKACPEELGNRLKCLISKVAAGALLFSIVPPPPAHAPAKDEFAFGPGEWFSWKMCLHGYTYIWALYVFLGVAVDVGALPTLLKGISPMPGFDNPLLASTCSRELWGSRWNMSIHTLIKRSVFKPVAFSMGLGHVVGSISTFLASGLLHEYIFALQFGPHHSTNSQVAPIPDFYEPCRSTFFFLIMGGVMLLEQKLADLFHEQKQQPLMRGFPAPVVVALHVALNAKPFAALFIHPWIASGLFHSIAKMFPTGSVACP